MLCEKLNELRENQGLNKKEFAKYLGIKYTTYNNYETGLREPSSDFLILVSEKLNVSIDYMLGLKDDRNILHSYKLLSGEYEHIKKYRELDTHGKDMVDTVLQKEYDRVVDIQNAEPKTNRKFDTIAAHARTDVEQTQDGIQHDLDIMNDDSQWD